MPGEQDSKEEAKTPKVAGIRPDAGFIKLAGRQVEIEAGKEHEAIIKAAKRSSRPEAHVRLAHIKSDGSSEVSAIEHERKRTCEASELPLRFSELHDQDLSDDVMKLFGLSPLPASSPL